MKNILFVVFMLLSNSLIAQSTDLIYQWANGLNHTDTLGGVTFVKGFQVDNLGNIYVAGNFGGTADFDPGPGTQLMTSDAVKNDPHDAGVDVFFAKYDANGNYLFAKKIGGIGDKGCNNMVIDSSGNIYIAGYFNNTSDFDPGPGVQNLTGSYSLFFAKYDTNGNYIFAKTLNPTQYNIGTTIAVDVNSNVFIVGDLYGSADFDPGNGVQTLTCPNAYTSLFFAKYDTNGNYLFAKLISGTSAVGSALAVTTDLLGNLYISGNFYEVADFNPNAGVANLTSGGGTDDFIAKYDPSGNYIYAKGFSGSSYAEGVHLTVDGSFNVYVTGEFNGTIDFDPGAGTQNLISSGLSDIFLAKYNSSGNYIFAKKIGGADNDDASAISLDVSNNIYITGKFINSVDFDPSASIQTLVSSGADDVYFAKYSTSGNFLLAKSIGGTSSESGNNIVVDENGFIYLAGYFQASPDFDPGAGNFTLSALGNGYDCFFGKYSGSASFVWANQIGRFNPYPYSATTASITSDASGNVYVTGNFSGTVDFDPGPSTQLRTSSGGFDIFLVKYNSSGNFVFVKNFGGTTSTTSGFGKSIKVDASNNIYITGSFNETIDFDPSASILNLTSLGSYDIFLAKYNAVGNLVFANRFGNTGADDATSLALDASSNIYVTGNFSGTVDFDPSISFNSLISSGLGDLFFAKYTSAGVFSFTRKIGGTSSDLYSSIALDASNNIYVTGSFSGTVDFDPGGGTLNLTASGSNDIYIAKYGSTGLLVYAKNIGGASAYSTSNSIAVDASGNTFITGSFNGTVDFNPDAGTLNLTGASSMYFAKYNSSGVLVFAKCTEGSYSCTGNEIVIDASGNSFISGYYSNTIDFDPGVGNYNLTSNSNEDIFISKYDVTGNIVYAKSMGSFQFDESTSIAIDLNSNVYVTGIFSHSVDFDPGSGVAIRTAVNKYDVFVVKFTEASLATGNTVSSICAGSAITIPYTASGQILSGNVFTAQLSDENGSFSNPVNIGNITSVTSGNIAAMIPSTTGSSPYYRVRVISSLPPLIGALNGFIISVNAFSNKLLNESVGTVSGNITIASHESSNGFDNDNFTMSGSASISNSSPSTVARYPSASGGANIFIDNVSNSYFEIQHILTGGMNHFQLSFGVFKNSIFSSDWNDLKVEVGNGVFYSQLDISSLPTGTGTNNWYYVTATGYIPTADTLRLRFSQDNTFLPTTEYRIDDIKLIKDEPSYAITTSTTNICNPGSIMLTATDALSYSWSTGATTKSINVNTAGNYSCNLTGERGSCIFPTNSLVITATNPTVYYRDVDLDGYGINSLTQGSCIGAPVGYTLLSGDCNDGNASINPGAFDICANGIDENCDLIIDNCTLTINIIAYIQGFYQIGAPMQPVLYNTAQSLNPNAVDSVTIQLRDVNSPHNLLAPAKKALLDIDGNISIPFSSSLQGQSCYIVLIHRNAIETWSKNPIVLAPVSTYNFTINDGE